MTTKSRLGKGLGALFPSLPGEPVSTKQPVERAEEPAKAVSKDVPVVVKGNAKSGTKGDRKNDRNDTATAQASVDAVRDMKKSVSRETKKNAHHRASMPSISLNESAHPADMFFGATTKPVSERDRKSTRLNSSH